VGAFPDMWAIFPMISRVFKKKGQQMALLVALSKVINSPRFDLHRSN